MEMGKLAFSGVILLTAGCSALSGVVPKQIQPPSATAQVAAADPALMDVDITLHVGSADRSVQFNGGNNPTAGLTDITNLVVGLFDYGAAGGSFVASLGYVHAPPAAAAAITISPNSPSYMGDLSSNRVGTAGTGAAASGCNCTALAGTARRYLVRDYGTATSFTSTTTVVFKNIPVSGAVHSYLVFAAAYDSASNNLGYGEVALSGTNAPSTAPGSNITSNAALTLNLKQGVYIADLSQTTTFTPFVPTATLRALMPF